MNTSELGRFTCGCMHCEHRFTHLHRHRRSIRPVLKALSDRVPLCSACHWPLTLEEAAANSMADLAQKKGICFDAKCREELKRRQRAAEQQKAEDAVRIAALWAELDRIRKQALAGAGLAGPEAAASRPRQAEDWSLLAVPGHGRGLTPLPADRRSAFIEHLRKAARSGFEADIGDQGQATEDSDSILAERTCGLCGGNCCLGGGDHAYLDATVIQAYRGNNPGAGRKEAEAYFIGRLPSVSVEGSCVYHGGAGCGLGELRSRVCKDHFCGPLLKAKNLGVKRAWVAVLTAGEPHWIRGPWPRPEERLLRSGFIQG